MELFKNVLEPCGGGEGLVRRDTYFRDRPWGYNLALLHVLYLLPAPWRYEKQTYVPASMSSHHDGLDQNDPSLIVLLLVQYLVSSIRKVTTT